MSEHDARVWQCTSEEYHADHAISQSKVKHFIEDSEDFYERDIAHSADRPDTKSYQQFGLDFEQLLFYNETPGELIPLEVLKEVQMDGKVQYRRDLRHPPYREFVQRMQEEHGDGVELMKPADWEKRVPPILIARDKLRSHDRANKLIYGYGEPHVAVKWVDPIIGLECKCQIDMLHGGLEDPRAIVDAKTAADPTPEGFRKAIGNFGYHFQAWWYQRGFFFLTGLELPVVFVVSKNTPSYKCETYDLSAKWFQLAKRDMTEGLHKLSGALHDQATLMQAGDDPSLAWKSDTHGRIITLEPMPWNK